MSGLKNAQVLLSVLEFGDFTNTASSPTKNIENIIRSFKTMITKEIGKSIWQRSYNDYIARGEKDYQKIWEYIDTNVLRWEKDCFYTYEKE